MGKALENQCKFVKCSMSTPEWYFGNQIDFPDYNFQELLSSVHRYLMYSEQKNWLMYFPLFFSFSQFAYGKPKEANENWFEVFDGLLENLSSTTFSQNFKYDIFLKTIIECLMDFWIFKL